MGDKVMEELERAASALSNIQLKVGFLEGATYPDGTPVAQIATVQEYGALVYHQERQQDINFKVTKSGKSRFAKKGKGNFQQTVNIQAHAVWIPPRPFFRNAIQSKESSWMEAIGDGVRKGHSIDRVLKAVGERIVGDIQESIATLSDPPLAPSTLKSRRSRRNKSDKPLVDTKVMLRAASYEIGSIQGDGE